MNYDSSHFKNINYYCSFFDAVDFDESLQFDQNSNQLF